MQPINRKKQRRWYILAEIGVYLFILFLSCHIGKIDFKDITSLMAGMEHMLDHPFDILPVDTAALGTGALLGLIPSLLIHTEYLRRRDLRPMVESGSAKWNEDLKAFYRTYTEITSWPAIFDRFRAMQKVRAKMIKLSETFSKIPVIGFFYKKIALRIAELFMRPEIGSGCRNMILSKNISMSMNGRKTQRNNNVIIIGGSGSGKSRFQVKPNILQANCSFVVTDPSGELLEAEGEFLRREGYELRVFNLVEMDHSNCYNPFHYVRNQEGVLIMINALIKNTTPKGSNTSDPFWEKAETALLQAICFYLVSECNKEDQNFSSVMKLLRCAKAVEGQEDVDSTLDIMFKDLAAREPEHIAVQSYAVFKSAGGGKTAQSILISCQTRLQTFNLDAIKKLTDTDSIDLGSIGDKKVALFCITPSADTTFNYLVALMYTQLFETLYFHAETQCQGKRLKSHVRFLLDEFANVGTIPDFAQKLSTMRKYEISCTIIIQALSQIKTMYKDDWEVLVGNCDTFIFLGGADMTTLEYVSKSLGKETIRSINNSRSYGRQGSHSLSYNKTGRELMTPDELRTMKNKNCVIFVRGENPFFTEKFKLEKHPNYRYSGDGDKKYLFDVKKEVHTARQATGITPPNELPMKIFKEAQVADTREADRQHRIHRRAVDRRTARGDSCFTIEPLDRTIPHFAVPAERLNQEELERRQAITDNLVLEEIHVPNDSKRKQEYTEDIKRTLAEIQAQIIFEEFGTDEEPEEATLLDTSEGERGDT